MSEGQPSPGLPPGLPRSFFAHPDSHPVVLDYAMLRTFGPEWLGWDGPVIRVEIEHEAGNPVSDHNMEKLQAVRAIHVSEQPYLEWHVFEKVIQALNNNMPEFKVVQACTPAQLLAGVNIMHQVRRSDFDDEVLRYIGACFLNNDLTYCPPPLDEAQEYVSKPVYECSKCGYKGNAEPGWSGLCEPCSGAFDPETMFSRNLKKKVKATKVTLTHDPYPVKKRWEGVKDKATDSVVFKENAVDIQLTKLLVARDYDRRRKEQMSSQLDWLKDKAA